MKKVIGLTGGIASGKSTVTNYLRQKGWSVIDADAVVHELQAKGESLYEALVIEFGNAILDAHGQLDRKTLSEKVFSQPDLRKRLSEIQDSIIRQELLARRDALLQEQDVVLMDIPLLFELGYERAVDETWLVYVDRAQQLSRLMERNGYNRKEAENRLGAQLSLEEKKEKAAVVIDNRGSMEETFHQVDAFLAQMTVES
ncbi:dephospho-CoA kinase [Streptococcus sp. X16XC17]|uniref:dephospho-CoA kinase n=1 Tax=unclassified Streptococcus TaxID=2608887 RepID=UPI00066FF2B6|nr:MULTISPECIES: dephospho-CoA kinase [unclassified Streptococcus]TCD46078.1 dephospho-CoA kinase [Streptococcus sp. X16XC17]